MDILQSLLFPKEKYTIEEVKNYLIFNKYKHNKLDITNNFIRARQRDQRYLRRKGYDKVKTILNKKTNIKKIIFYSSSSS